MLIRVGKLQFVCLIGGGGGGGVGGGGGGVYIKKKKKKNLLIKNYIDDKIMGDRVW